MLTKIMSSLEEEHMQTQYIFLSYRIQLYFHEHKLAIEIDENRQRDRNKKTKSNIIRAWLQIY